MNRLQEILDRVTQLPPLPDTSLRLIQITNDPRSTTRDVFEVVRYDQAITAEVLRLCNSPHLGLPRTVQSLDEAVRYLGMLKILNLVLAMNSSALLLRAQEGYGMPAGVLWRHSVAVAVGSVQFADLAQYSNRSLAFTAGLLHDIGKVILQTYVGESLDEILRCVNEQGKSFDEAEHEVLGCSQDEVGAAVATRWQLPAPLIQAIRHHQKPGELIPHEPLVDIVHLANCVVLMLGIGLGSDELNYRTDPDVLRRQKLTELDLERAGMNIIAELRAIEAVFGVESQSDSKRLAEAR